MGEADRAAAHKDLPVRESGKGPVPSGETQRWGHGADGIRQGGGRTEEVPREPGLSTERELAGQGPGGWRYRCSPPRWDPAERSRNREEALAAEPFTSLHMAPRSREARLLCSRSQMPTPPLGHPLLTHCSPRLHLAGLGAPGGRLCLPRCTPRRLRARPLADFLSD